MNSLHLAVENNDLASAARLLQEGADHNVAGKFGRLPIHVAARLPDPAMLSLLLTVGASLNLKSSHGFTPLYIAAVSNNLETLEFIIKSSGGPFDIDDSDKGGLTPLMAAVCNRSSLEVIQLLVQNGASLNRTDSIGRRARDWATAKGFNELEGALL